MPTGTSFGRDAAARYYKGGSLPGSVHLTAMAKALGVDPSDLVPNAFPVVLPRAAATAATAEGDGTTVSDAGGGMAWLRVNTKVDWPTALKIMEMLKGDS